MKFIIILLAFSFSAYGGDKGAQANCRAKSTLVTLIKIKEILLMRMNERGLPRRAEFACELLTLDDYESLQEKRREVYLNCLQSGKINVLEKPESSLTEIINSFGESFGIQKEKKRSFSKDLTVFLKQTVKVKNINEVCERFAPFNKKVKPYISD